MGEGIGRLAGVGCSGSQLPAHRGRGSHVDPPRSAFADGVAPEVVGAGVSHEAQDPPSDAESASTLEAADGGDAEHLPPLWLRRFALAGTSSEVPAVVRRDVWDGATPHPGDGKGDDAGAGGGPGGGAHE